MRYFGGKARIGKQIAEKINSYLDNDKEYYEPFVGGGWVSQYINCNKKYLSDINPYLISMFCHLQTGWTPPEKITKKEYEQAKNGKAPDYLKGFIGFGCSFAGKWFGGYANSKTRNYCLNAKNSILKKMKKLNNAIFFCIAYDELNPQNSVIYCDPPYENTTKYDYVGKFDHNKFWNVMRKWSKNNKVFISEYNAPEDFKCVAEFKTKTDIRNKNNKKEDRVEKLFTYRD